MIDKMKTYLSPNRFIPNDYEELTALELIGKQNAKIDEVVEETNNLNINKVSHGDDFKGSWHGIKHPSLTNEGVGEVVNSLSNLLSSKLHLDNFIDDDETDLTVVINRVLNLPYQESSSYYNHHITVVFNPMKNYLIRDTIYYNPSLVTIEGNSSILKCVGMNDNFKVGMVVGTGGQWADSRTGMKSLSSLTIKGEKVGNSIGILYENCADLLTEKIRVEGFNYGVKISKNSYILSFNHCNIGGNEVGVFMPYGLENYGERINFTDCNIGNGGKSIINNNPDGHISLINCSLDYNKTGVIEINSGGKVVIDNCHIEQPNTLTETPFIVNGNGSTLVVKNSILFFMSSTTEINYIVEGDGTSSFQHCFLNNLKTKTDCYSSDRGVHDFYGSTVYDINDNPRKMNNVNTTFNNGDFSQHIIRDLFWVSGDTGTIHDRQTGDNVSFAFSPTDGGIKVVKNYGSGSTAKITFAFPLIRDGKRNIPMGGFNYRKSSINGSGGQINVKYEFANLVDTLYPKTPEVFRTKEIVSGSFSINKDDTSWKKESFGSTNKKFHSIPNWASHILVTWDLFGYDGNSKSSPIIFKDFYFYQI